MFSSNFWVGIKYPKTWYWIRVFTLNLLCVFRYEPKQTSHKWFYLFSSKSIQSGFKLLRSNKICIFLLLMPIQNYKTLETLVKSLPVETLMSNQWRHVTTTKGVSSRKVRFESTLLGKPDRSTCSGRRSMSKGPPKLSTFSGGGPRGYTWD